MRLLALTTGRGRAGRKATRRVRGWGRSDGVRAGAARGGRGGQCKGDPKQALEMPAPPGTMGGRRAQEPLIQRGEGAWTSSTTP